MKRKINIDELPANNGKDDKPTISGGVRVKKAKSGFASDVRDIGNTLFTDVVSPALRTIITDFVTSALEMVLWGDRRSGYDRGRNSGRRDYTTYSSSSRRGRPTRAAISHGGRTPELKDIYFDLRADADHVLREMIIRAEEYGWVSVGDLYALCGVTATHNDEQYGWYQMQRVRVVSTEDGYLIDLPRPAYRS